MRTVERSQVVRFYLWALRQDQAYRTMGLAAMVCYLTRFRAAEIRPYQTSGITDAGVNVVGAKRKKGESETLKLRHWSTRLRVVVEHAKRDRKVDSLFLFSESPRAALLEERVGFSLARRRVHVHRRIRFGDCEGV